MKQSVLDSSQSYVDDAILAPLEKGRLDQAYAQIFDRGVRRAATGHDRAALTEVRTGSLKAPLKATATKVRLDGMGDQTGKLVLVAATFGVNVNAKGSGGPVKIQRLAELTFAPEHGRWVVTAYRVGVKRTMTAQTTAAVACCRSDPMRLTCKGKTHRHEALGQTARKRAVLRQVAFAVVIVVGVAARGVRLRG